MIARIKVTEKQQGMARPEYELYDVHWVDRQYMSAKRTAQSAEVELDDKVIQAISAPLRRITIYLNSLGVNIPHISTQARDIRMKVSAIIRGSRMEVDDCDVNIVEIIDGNEKYN